MQPALDPALHWGGLALRPRFDEAEEQGDDGRILQAHLVAIDGDAHGELAHLVRQAFDSDAPQQRAPAEPEQVEQGDCGCANRPPPRRVAPSTTLGAAAPPRASTRSSTIASLRLPELSISNSRSIRSTLCCSGCV